MQLAQQCQTALRFEHTCRASAGHLRPVQQRFGSEPVAGVRAGSSLSSLPPASDVSVGDGGLRLHGGGHSRKRIAAAATNYSITSSARSRIDGGTARPSALTPPGAELTRFRALALFGRRPPCRVVSSSLPASKDLHNWCNGRSIAQGAGRPGLNLAVIGTAAAPKPASNVVRTYHPAIGACDLRTVSRGVYHYQYTEQLDNLFDL